MKYGGFDLSAVGDAHLDPQGTALRVHNLGSSGLDGVRANLGGESYVGVGWRPPVTVPGEEVSVTVHGTAGGAADSPLGTLRMTHGAGGQREIAADYSALGSPTLTIEVWSQGQLIFAKSGHTGLVATTDQWPDCCSKRDVWPSTGTACFAGKWPDIVSLSIPGSGTFPGDELRVLAEGGGTVTSLDSVQVTSNASAGLTLTGIRDEPAPPSLGSPYCVANPNSTGVPATIVASGSIAAADNDLVLSAIDLPAFSFAFYIVSADQAFVAHPAGSAGNLCVGGAIGRGPGGIFSSGPLGAGEVRIDLTALPTPTGTESVFPGDTRHFQLWYRDVSGGTAPATSATDSS